MTIMSPQLTCGPTRLRCEQGMTWLERVLATGWDVSPTGCWEWRGERGSHGRARIANSTTRKYPYRITYEAVNGPIPDGMVACHTCENPGCVNPDHIVAGTQMDNLRMVRRESRSNALSDQAWEDIRVIYATGRITQTQLARAYMVDQKTISRIVRTASNG